MQTLNLPLLLPATVDLGTRRFRRDIEGNVVAIQCANQTRDSFMKQQLPLVEPTIRALRKLDDVLYENHIRFKLEEGAQASTTGPKSRVQGQGSRI